MEKHIWRLYDAINQTSIFCETQEECEHLISKFAEGNKQKFMNDCEDYSPFYSDIEFIDEDYITPMGYECRVIAKCMIKLPNWGTHFDCRIASHYFYYRDRDAEHSRDLVEEQNKKRKLENLRGYFELYGDTDSVKKPYVPPTFTAIIRGEVCKFVAETASPTDWTQQKPKTSHDEFMECEHRFIYTMSERFYDSARKLNEADTWVKIPISCENFKKVMLKIMSITAPF